MGLSDLKYLHVARTNKMTNNLNMDNKSIIHLRPPTNPTDAATKKYVDDNKSTAPDLSPYLKKDGSVPMTENLNVAGYKIMNLKTPNLNSDATTKEYVDIGALARARLSTMGKKIWLWRSVRSPPARPPVHTLHVSRCQMSQ